MALWISFFQPPASSPLFPLLSFLVLFLFIIYSPTTTVVATTVTTTPDTAIDNHHHYHVRKFREAPAFRNGETCTKERIHIAMTLDANYLRGTMAAVFSILHHSACPQNAFFHFLWARPDPLIVSSINTTFPYLNYDLYLFDIDRVRDKISKSIREALDQPLNYARIYLADIVPTEVSRVIYLDSDLVLVDDVAKLWDVNLENKVVAAPEYCHANFRNYFTVAFWAHPIWPSKAFRGKKPCYFNSGVMVVDVARWREGEYTKKVEEWMLIQKETRIYDLGSLPPFLLVFAGDIKSVDHRWNQHGLGGDNILGSCRGLHSGPISLLHWSGKGKPWIRLDTKKPCNVDHLWAPYDLYHNSMEFLEQY